MELKAIGAFTVSVSLLCIGILSQSYLAYASSSQKIFLEQKFEQFPGQKINGFCNLELDDAGNLSWRIKVYGLSPNTEGYFDLGHWAGEESIKFTADDSGKADSQNQMVPAGKFSKYLFTELAKCQVLIAGYNYLTSQVIATGGQGSDQENTEKNDDVDSKESANNNSEVLSNNTNYIKQEDGQSSSKGNKFFLFSTLEYVFSFITHFNGGPDSNNLGSFTNSDSEKENKNNSLFWESHFFGPPPPSNHSENEKSKNSKSVDAPLEKVSNKSDDKGQKDNPSAEKKNDKTPSDQSSNDKSSDQSSNDKSSDQSSNDKNSQKGSKENNKQNGSDRGSEDKSSSRDSGNKNTDKNSEKGSKNK